MTKVRRHEIPARMLAELAAGRGGARAARLLGVVRLSRSMLLIRGIVETARATGHEDAVRARNAYELLAEIQERDPGAVDDMLRHPAVGAWAWWTFEALRGRDGGRGARPGGLAAVAAAAAVRSGAECSIEVPAHAGRVTLPSLGQAELRAGPAATAILSTAGGAAEITAGGRRVDVPADPAADAPGWHGMRRISVRARGVPLTLTIDDLDPHRMRAMRVAGRSPADRTALWEERVAEAWEVLVRSHRTTASEVQGLIRVLTPLAVADGHQVSATSRETFGCVGLSMPPGGRDLALVLAHEIQHAKLTAVMDAVPLVRPGGGRRHYAPWRDDPRPISGLLQGAYAYLGVTRFWGVERHREPGSLFGHAEFARWRAAVETAAGSLLESGLLTAAGTAFVSDMLGALREWGADEVPEPALRAARRSAESHRARWNLRNSPAARPDFGRRTRR